MNEDFYKNKYLKYKMKYVELKQKGGFLCSVLSTYECVDKAIEECKEAMVPSTIIEVFKHIRGKFASLKPPSSCTEKQDLQKLLADNNFIVYGLSTPGSKEYITIQSDMKIITHEAFSDRYKLTEKQITLVSNLSKRIIEILERKQKKLIEKCPEKKYVL